MESPGGAVTFLDIAGPGFSLALAAPVTLSVGGNDLPSTDAHGSGRLAGLSQLVEKTPRNVISRAKLSNGKRVAATIVLTEQAQQARYLALERKHFRGQVGTCGKVGGHVVAYDGGLHSRCAEMRLDLAEMRPNTPEHAAPIRG